MATSKKSATSTNNAATPTKPKLKKVAKGKPLKYTDKSAGQPELISIFNEIKSLMKPYEKGTIQARGEKDGVYNLVSEKTFELQGKLREEVYFATIMVQKGFVGFYFMPVYGETALKDRIHPDLLKCLKGKACFHIKKNDPEMMNHIKAALKVGYEGHKKLGWAE